MSTTEPPSPTTTQPLPHHLHRTLRMLLTDRDQTVIADDLDLSVHTVRGYARQVYTHFGVRSRIELMARFIPDAPETPTAPDDAARP